MSKETLSIINSLCKDFETKNNETVKTISEKKQILENSKKEKL